MPRLEVREAPARRHSPGYKSPARGIARYPWAATILTLLIIGLGVYTFYLYRFGPLAPRPVQSKSIAAVSPCLSASILHQITDTAPAPSTSVYNSTPHAFSHAPAMSITTSKVYCAGINTNRGLLVLELDPSLAPQTVNNFVYLAQHHFYDGMVFHRVLQANQATSGSGPYIIQTGDPLGKNPATRGTGGPGYTIPAEPVKGNYTLGAVAMAKKATGTANSGSQFFICTGNDTSLPKVYNLFGHVVKGINVATKIQGPGDAASTKNVTPDVMNHVVVVAA